MDFLQKEKYNVEDLLSIVHTLRSPGGCPWDQEQTHASIRQNFIEETYEAVEAIDLCDAELLREELGDVLLQIVLHAEMEAEAECFTFQDVCDGICKKLIYRHPHVFGQVQALSPNQALKNWETLKNAEKGRETAADRLDSVPNGLPAAMRASKVQKRAAAFGFTYDSPLAALQDLESELQELREAMAQGVGQAEEAGDVLFSAVNVARLLGLDAELVLTSSTDKFANRVKAVEAMADAHGTKLPDVTAETLDVLWKKAKAEEQEQGPQQNVSDTISRR